MCGRYKQTSHLQAFREFYGIAGADGPAPAGILAPGAKAPVVREGAVAWLRWGFTPHWSKEDMGAKLINARAETITEKPSFRESFATRRCIVPADGFFEWDKLQKPPLPYDIHFTGGQPFAFAGLWDAWTDPATGEVKETFIIVTTQAASAIAHIHDRMPALLATAEECRVWNSPETPAPALKKLLRPCDSGALAWAPARLGLSPANEDLSEDARQLPLF